MAEPAPPRVESARAKARPGLSAAQEFQARREAGAAVAYFLDLIGRHYRRLAPRFEVYAGAPQTDIPFHRYLEAEKDGLAGLNAFLVRDFFSRTTIAERELEVFEFLTLLLARGPGNRFHSDRDLPDEQQKVLVAEFLHFLGSLGDTPLRKLIAAKTYRKFINAEFAIMEREGGVSGYIASSLAMALTQQRDLLIRRENENYLESVYQRHMRRKPNFCLDNILAYLKALTVVRFLSFSRKEDRGRDDLERERFLFELISFSPSWYQRL